VASTREQMLMELRVVLSSSLRQKEVLGRFYEEVSRRLVVADCAAFCVSKPGPNAGYDWDVEKMPEQFFARYSSVAKHDFVLQAVRTHPNMVLSDQEMMAREELRRSRLYSYCRDMGMPLEHVLAVLLDVGADWHAGFTLYRVGQRPFSDQERVDLQSLTPGLVSTVRNCRLMAPVANSPDLVEALYRQTAFECIVMSPPKTEMMRTAGLTPLLERWFSRLECDRSGVPIFLLGELSLLASSLGTAGFGQDTLVRTRGGRSLVITYVPLPRQDDQMRWAVVFQEESIVPREWRPLLSPREIEVLEGLLLGLTNKDIAAQGEGTTVNTVKTQLKDIFRKLRVRKRSQLFSAAKTINSGGVWGRRI